jgi:hypothetical protein
MMSDTEDPLGDLIFSYTRKMALEDGVLIHVPNRVYRYHTAVTSEVWTTIDIKKLDAFLVASVVAQGKTWETGALFNFENAQYKVECGPGDDVEPVITVMMPWED